MRKLILSAIFLILFSLTTVLGDNITTTQYCQDNSTLIHLKHVTIDITGTHPNINRTRTFDVTEAETCTWGCRNDTCVSPPWIVYGIIFAVIIVAIFIFLILKP